MSYRINSPPKDQGLSKDISVNDATDTISSIRWSPAQSSHLAAGAWDGVVRVYDLSNTGNLRSLALIKADGPVMSCDFSKDGKHVAAAGADKKIHVLDAPSGQTMSFAAHEQPIRAVRFLDIPHPAPIIASGSWDKTVRYFDLRNTSQPLSKLPVSERVYSMDTAKSVLVIATADQKMHVVNLQADPTAILRSEPSPLKHQTRVVALSHDAKHWVTGGIEGRIAVTRFNQSEEHYNFTFKCHRDPAVNKQTKVFAINDVSFYPLNTDIMATAGSDGTFSFWDVQNRMRIKAFPVLKHSLSACSFSPDGKAFAYAVGYDWSMGYQVHKPDNPRYLKVHAVNKDEVTPKKK